MNYVLNIDLWLVPIGVGTSLSPDIKICRKIIEDSNLTYLIGLNGTAMEGNWEDVLMCKIMTWKNLSKGFSKDIYNYQIKYKNWQITKIRRKNE